jgi:glutamate racemase
VDNRPIGFLDSGVGGLSLLAAAKRLLPRERYLMLADGRHFPYGQGEPALVCERAIGLTRFLLDRDAKMIVVACNTATVHALGFLRETFPGVPFVGVVPVVKTLARRTRTGTIAVLSTPATADSDYLAGLIREFAAGRRVVNVPCPGLAELVEGGEVSSARTLALLGDCLAAVQASDADVVGLGCTHYLFLRPAIKRLLGKSVSVFDPSRPVARRIRQVLNDRKMLADDRTVGDEFYTTGNALQFASIASRLLRQKIDSAKQAEV